MRVHDWWGHLNAFILENRGRTREYGIWDCWQFTGAAVLLMTGVDYRERFPSYRSIDEGARILAKHGGAQGMMSELFGPPQHVALAKRGDIVIADLGEGPAGGICLGVNTATVAPAGIEFVPTLSGIASWPI
jgi:hypothetical protein